MDLGLGIVLFAIFAVIYFIPTVIATYGEKRNTGAIFVLNLFTGWTFIGWIIALVWAFTYERPRDILG